MEITIKQVGRATKLPIITCKHDNVDFELDNNGGAIAICLDCETQIELEEPPYFRDEWEDE